MRTRLLPALCATIVAAGCGFPPVPRGSDPGIRPDRRGHTFTRPVTPTSPPLYDAGGAPEETAGPLGLGSPQELRGTLVGNAVSHYVIRTDEGWVTLQLTPQTQLRIGDERAGLREIQPGTEVRASAVPARGGTFHLAVEVVAEPESVGWPAEKRERKDEKKDGAQGD